VRGNGRGGRNVEFLLSLGVALDGRPGIHAIAGDTDGVDGMEDIAGAYLGPTASHAPGPRVSNPRTASMPTTAMASSKRSATPL
jgi:glycerate-2-kinase